MSELEELASVEDSEQQEILRAKRYNRGLAFVAFIAIANVVISIVDQIISYISYEVFSISGIVSIVFQLVISLLLLSGIALVRYLLAANAALYSFIYIIQTIFIFGELQTQDADILRIVTILLFLVYYLFCTVTLFFSKNITEYFRV